MGDFLCLVDAKGYRWADVAAVAKDGRGGEKGRFIIPRSASSPGDKPVRAYDPLNDPALFRRFMDTEGTEAAIRDFADEYGLLGKPVGQMVAVPTAANSKVENLSQGVALGAWRLAVHEMNRAVRIWDWVLEKNVDELRRHIHWSGSDDEGYQVAYFDKPIGKGKKPSTKQGFQLIASSAAGDEALIDRFAKDDLIAPATALVRNIVNDKLKMAASPYLIEVANDILASSVRLKPKGLLGALWVQFAYAIENNDRFRRCDHCASWFQYEPGRGRYPRQYCSQAHKVAAHRLAKKATSLRQEGLSPSAVAKRLDVPVERIRAMESN